MPRTSHPIRIPFSKPAVGNDELRTIRRVLRSGWITTGAETLKFEQAFAAALFHEQKSIRALAVQSATAGLHLALTALDVGFQDAVVTTPLTFIATASAVLHTGARVLFIDCKKNSDSPDEAELKRVVREHKNVKVFLPVHLGGCACDNFSELTGIARARGLHIVEDAAHAFPARERDKRSAFLGTSGDIGVYSFYANKTITTAEGGMVVCKDPRLAERISVLRGHGINKPVWNRFTDAPLQYEYDVQTLGFKYNLPDVLSAMGMVQLKKADRMRERRLRAALRYQERLKNIKYIELPYVPRDETAHSWHLFRIQINHPSLSRDDFIRRLANRGIGTSVHYKPLHLMSYFHDEYTPDMFPNALERYLRTLSLPLYSDIRLSDVDTVCDAIIYIGNT